MSNHCRLGLCTCLFSSNGWMQEENLAIMQRNGFEILELSLVPEEYQIETFKRYLSDTGICLWSLHSYNSLMINVGHPNPENRMKMVANIHRCIDMVVELGGKAVIVHPGVLKDEDRGGQNQGERVKECLWKVVLHARRCRVVLCIENMFGNIWGEKIEEIEELMTEFPPDVIGACLDTGHGNLAGNTLEMLSMMEERLFTTHLNDNLGKDKLELLKRDVHLIPGDGTVVWGHVTERLLKKYRIPLIFEIHPNQRPLQENLARLKLILPDSVMELER